MRLQAFVAGLVSGVCVTVFGMALLSNRASAQDNSGDPRVSQERIIAVTIAELEKRETGERLATFARNYYRALLDRGFKEQEALGIVQTAGVPTFATTR